MSTPLQDNTADRLDRLERKLRAVKSGTIVAFFVLAAVAVAGWATPWMAAGKLKSVEVERLALLDRSGQLRAELTVANDEPRLALFDGYGKKRLSLKVGTGGDSALELFDSRGTPQARVLANDRGDRYAGLGFLDGNGIVRTIMGVENGSPNWTVLNASGQQSVRCEPGFLALYDGDGKVARIRVDINTDLARILLSDANAQGRVLMATARTGPALALTAENGQIIFSKP
jgi:hypothetical protein